MGHIRHDNYMMRRLYHMGVIISTCGFTQTWRCLCRTVSFPLWLGQNKIIIWFKNQFCQIKLMKLKIMIHRALKFKGSTRDGYWLLTSSNIVIAYPTFKPNIFDTPIGWLSYCFIEICLATKYLKSKVVLQFLLGEMGFAMALNRRYPAKQRNQQLYFELNYTNANRAII